jgi:hypothetical protein
MLRWGGAPVVLLVLVATASLAAGGDWKGDLAKRVVTHAVREGLEEAAEEAALDVALNAAADAIGPDGLAYGVSRLPDLDIDFDEYVEVGDVVSDGIESAMRVADVADKLDDAADAVRAVKRLGNIRRR